MAYVHSGCYFGEERKGRHLGVEGFLTDVGNIFRFCIFLTCGF